MHENKRGYNNNFLEMPPPLFDKSGDGSVDSFVEVKSVKSHPTNSSKTFSPLAPLWNFKAIMCIR